MSNEDLSTNRKALTINLNRSIYGTFAEIGAGQEVARHFFQAGLASNTVAKTMSAYDMTFSDAIYGKGQRYVSESRLLSMLDHEYSLLEERLKPTRGNDCTFFVFADTVATSSGNSDSHCHGWLGVRFQTKPNGPYNDVAVHVELLDGNRLQQQDALSTLGVNLIYAAFNHLGDQTLFLESLLDNIGRNRVAVDIVRFNGPDSKDIDNRIVALKMIELGLCQAATFNPDGKVMQAGDFLYGKPILVQRGTFRPVTTANVDILCKALEQLKKNENLNNEEPVSLLEISIKSLEEVDGKINYKDFLDRVDTINSLGHSVMLSEFVFHYQLKKYLRRGTDHFIAMVIGASHLEELFNESYYDQKQGGILNAFGELFDDNTRILVFPYKSDLLCTTASTFHPQQNLDPLFRFLLQNRMIVDILGCDDVDTSTHSAIVRKLLASGDNSWESMVPEKVRNLIKSRKLFGYKK